MTSYRTDRTDPTEKLLQEKLSYHTDLKLIYMLSITSNPPGTTDAVFTKLPFTVLHAHSLKTAKTL